MAESVDDDEQNVGLAFGLVTAAGLSTTFGAAMVYADCVFTESNKKVLGGALGFASGVMLYVSFVEIFPEGVNEFSECECLWNADDLEEDDEDRAAAFMGTLMFFLGVVIIYLMDMLVHYLFTREGNDVHHMSLTPESVLQNGPHSPGNEKLRHTVEETPNMLDRNAVSSQVGRGSHVEKADSRVASRASATANPMHDGEGQLVAGDNDLEEDVDEIDEEQRALKEMGILTAVAIALHNFPEGLATLAGTLADEKIGITLAIAIAIHNIPEGLCVAIPIYYATGSRWTGFWMAFWSGVSEIIGAAIGYLFLEEILGPAGFAIMFAVVGGMMIAIVLKELLPTAHRYDPEDMLVTKGVFLGMGVMALSLLLE